jgi:glycosyltransferase involved in cell wall biosynthesis
MIARGIFSKMLGKKLGNACDDYSITGLLKLAYQKNFRVSDFIDRETVNGVEVWRVDGFFFRPPVEDKNHTGWIEAGLATFDAYVRLNGKPDVVHAHNAVYAGMLAKVIKEKYSVPFVLTEHSTAFARNTIVDPKILRRIKTAYASASVLTAVSEPFCQLLNRKFSIDRFQCLHNVLDPDFEKKAFTTVIERRPEFVFVNIAELHPKKDHLGLLDGFKKLYEQKPNARLWIGGGGEFIEVLKAKVKEENLEAAVRLLGPLNREKVFDALQKADCFVLTSKYETFGLVVIESMLVGKPVIVTRCGGPESFVTPQTGVVIEKENAAQLANAMQEMMTTAGQYSPEQIRQFAIGNFGAAAFVTNAEKFYREAIGLHTTKKESARKMTNALAS